MASVSYQNDLPPAYEYHRSDSIVLPAATETSSDTSSAPIVGLADLIGHILLEGPKTPGVDELQSPPDYARQDPDVRCFSLQAPFISAAPFSPSTTTSFEPLPLPRYQLSQLRSSLGKPYKLSLRRLTATESRRASLTLSSSSTSSSSAPRQRIDFDDDLVVYEVSNTAALHRFSHSANVQIIGCKARSLRGHIELADLSKRTGACRFWHLRRKADAIVDASQDKMRKWGYKPEDEWNKDLLFDVGAESAASRGRPWKDGSGNILAIESGSDLKFVETVDLPKKEAMLACWATRRWVLNQLEWLSDA
ncbi:hypothetical protein B0T11DRAFT_140544 [Plectosphaerella cucumerina]|uniref:Uncharacterized protein n=1 Tax=Plectosphaerella cucumerina TaxID=40658 RepID=A0A8K0T4V9_9PEZI|nr:hypothetical protein B0T11DRAFT_140544 [Plectosphaerella cucumerina]